MHIESSKKLSHLSTVQFINNKSSIHQKDIIRRKNTTHNTPTLMPPSAPLDTPAAATAIGFESSLTSVGIVILMNVACCYASFVVLVEKITAVGYYCQERGRVLS